MSIKSCAINQSLKLSTKNSGNTQFNVPEHNPSRLISLDNLFGSQVIRLGSSLNIFNPFMHIRVAINLKETCHNYWKYCCSLLWKDIVNKTFCVCKPSILF